MAFTAKDVQALREKTGCGMMDCKKALTETNGDMDAAADFLREKGLASQAKKLLSLTAKPTSLPTVTALRHSPLRLQKLLQSRIPLTLMHFLSAKRTVSPLRLRFRSCSLLSVKI